MSKLPSIVVLLNTSGSYNRIKLIFTSRVRARLRALASFI